MTAKPEKFPPGERGSDEYDDFMETLSDEEMFAVVLWEADHAPEPANRRLTVRDDWLRPVQPSRVGGQSWDEFAAGDDRAAKVSD